MSLWSIFSLIFITSRLSLRVSLWLIMSSIIFRNLLPFLILALITSQVFAIDTGARGQGNTATKAYQNCAANTSASNTLTENGSCDYYPKAFGDVTACSARVTASNPKWWCANAVVYCSISGKVMYQSACHIGTSNGCTASQWFNSTTGRCDVKTTCIGSQTFNNANNTCTDPNCSPLILDPVLKTCVSALNCTPPKVPSADGLSCVFPDGYNCSDTPIVGDTFLPNGTLDNPTPRCACPLGTVQVDTNNDGNVECVPQQTCDPAGNTYMGTMTAGGVVYQICTNQNYCETGYVFGQVNGVATCVNNTFSCTGTQILVNGVCQDPQPDPPLPPNTQTVTQNPDGSTTTVDKTTTTSTNNSNGQTTTTTVTTTTNTTAGGVSTTSTTTTEEITPPDTPSDTDLTNEKLSDILDKLNSTATMTDIPAFETYEVKSGTFFDQLQQVPIVNVGGSFVNAFSRPDVTCPQYGFTIELFGQSVTLNFDIVCDLWQDIEGTMRNIFKLCWLIMAWFILMSA